MNKAVVLGAIALAGVVALQVLSPARRHRFGAGVRHRLTKRMESVMASLPEQSPPRLITSILPELRKQNEEIIAMLREQNALLREQRGEAQR
jgi:hypothetical protein